MAISFAQSERSTLGVEWELQLIDIDSEDLRQCAGAILSEISARYPDDTLIHGEMLRNTIELVSRKQTRVRDASRGPDRRRFAPICKSRSSACF